MKIYQVLTKYSATFQYYIRANDEESAGIAAKYLTMVEAQRAIDLGNARDLDFDADAILTVDPDNPGEYIYHLVESDRIHDAEQVIDAGDNDQEDDGERVHDLLFPEAPDAPSDSGQ